MPDLYDFNSVFFLSLSTMVFGFCSVALGYALKSKCTSVKLCGCLEIIRDVELEADLEEQRIPPPPLVTEPVVREATPVGSRRQSRSNGVDRVDFVTSMDARV